MIKKKYSIDYKIIDGFDLSEHTTTLDLEAEGMDEAMNYWLLFKADFLMHTIDHIELISINPVDMSNEMDMVRYMVEG
jgi:hypothetical protein